jgi:hypothetical protein
VDGASFVVSLVQIGVVVLRFAPNRSGSSADAWTTSNFWPTYRTIWATTNLRPGTPAKKRKKRNFVFSVFSGFLPFHLHSDENGSFRRLLDWLSAVPVFFLVGPNEGNLEGKVGNQWSNRLRERFWRKTLLLAPVLTNAPMLESIQNSLKQGQRRPY